MIPATSPAARRLLRRSLHTGCQITVIYLGADALAHSRSGRVAAIHGSRFLLDYLDPAGTARRARFDLARPDEVLAVEPLR